MDKLKQLIKALDEQITVSKCTFVLLIIIIIWLLNSQTITEETIIEIIK